MITKLPAYLLSLLPVFAFASVSSHLIDLPVIENIAAEKIAYEVSLDTLQTNILYTLSCSVVNIEGSDNQLLLEPHLLASSPYGNAQLNDQTMENNRGTLQLGENHLSFQVLIGKDDLEKYNRFTLTSLSEKAVQINHCVAAEFIPGSKKLNSKAMASSSGFFQAFNDTDHTVTIGVGNIFPTEYKIPPHDWKAVIVSTDNQNIHIKNIQ